MGKSTHFFGQPVYDQLIKSLDRAKIYEMSRKHGGERYVKSFDGCVHLAFGVGRGIRWNAAFRVGLYVGLDFLPEMFDGLGAGL